MIVEPQLVEAACRGDTAAVERLLVICQPDLRRFARRACSTGEDAEDAVQIALWQLYRKIGALRTAATFASWLFKIVERECYRLFRARTKIQTIDESLDNVAIQDPFPVELRNDLVAAIAQLPEPYRKILILRDIDELTAPEAAEQLGISVEAAKSRLHRARMMVRESLLGGGYLAVRSQELTAPPPHYD
ncbi:MULTISPECIES: sigma-70 family RNA polymerase sigma factor [unclassified Bradyrhizobium]|uniref:RNA polymerase sigma factor n=1 Tax=unclassified Bradyrhizobium TaxID=2631580 RepID=UPI00247A71E6|nr:MULTISPECIES: sigma-70 family RNA polymerase sigma factor [unclassified Bradyrhizobium]WGR73794.1 sigma-70 family RNA polymerase sigma factor [Bradyrhizobium sp. ISRA426]WGR78632.1 sigma-70 family RNA polymerase sigma factor [Bradyrhizobium sp. ISRA430]WGR89033.1 sigma-70 family RNA polymerase sigma factor [Bradyrhizobium sp. ISRA432]